MDMSLTSSDDRVVAVKELPNIIHNLETSDIVEYIVPLIQSLGSDSGTLPSDASYMVSVILIRCLL